MKKIINGKRYDTETATHVANYSWGGRSDFRWYNEDLYRTKSGSYFLAGEGNGASKYRSSANGNGWTWGEKITPLSYDEAFEWAQEFMTTEAVEREFGTNISDA